MRRTERVAYRTKFYSNLSSPTRFDEEPIDFATASSLNDFYFRFSPRVKTAIQPRPV